MIYKTHIKDYITNNKNGYYIGLFHFFSQINYFESNLTEEKEINNRELYSVSFYLRKKEEKKMMKIV